MLVMHAHQRPVPPSKRANISVPEQLEELILQCLDKNPNRRPQTARELGDRLRETGLAREWNRSRREAWWQALKAAQAGKACAGTRTRSTSTSRNPWYPARSQRFEKRREKEKQMTSTPGSDLDPARSLAGKVLFITGASRGIGEAIALRAARDGAAVAVVGKTERAARRSCAAPCTRRARRSRPPAARRWPASQTFATRRRYSAR